MLATLFLGILLTASPMGKLDFSVTGNVQCNKLFQDGMLALHSFMYERAHASFAAAAKADPNCAMARWGEAMAYNHPLWGVEDVARGRAALAKVSGESRLTTKERAYLATARALYGDGDPKSRLKAWLAAAERMHEQFPEDDEVALAYALALIADSEDLTDGKKMMRAAAIGLDVMARKPNHPGAAHYMIHACDTPEHAILALPAAERYAKIAPAASHALHMPSHIFVQLGMWERAARSNEASVAATMKDHAKDTIDTYDWHSYSWLVAAYAELGQLQRARKLLDDLAARLGKEDHAGPRFAYSEAVHLYLEDSGAWEQLDELLKPIASPLPVEKGDPSGSLGCAQHAPGGALATRYPVGLIALQNVHLMHAEAAAAMGDESTVRVELQAAAPLREAMAPWVSLLPKQWAERQQAESAALLAMARAHYEQKESAWTAAAAALKKLGELRDPFASGPSFSPPADQMLGELYLVAGKPKEALSAFEAALDKHPRTSRSLLGAARAAKAAGQAELAKKYYGELKSLWENADAELPDLAEVRANE
jgi:tetratricopeptide (TPR) repeat protein